MPFHFLSPLTIPLILTILLFRLTYDYTRLHSRIPGPFLPSITDLYRFYHQNTSSGLRKKLLQLHSSYGPIVRYGVNSISISTPSAIPTIYGARAGFVTADSYKVLTGISNGKEVPSLVSTAEESKHGALRRCVAGAFTPSGVLPLEGCIDQTIREFRDILKLKFKRADEFDLPWWMLLFSMDSAARQAFSESRGYLEAGDDVDGSIQLVRSRIAHWGRWLSLPGLERVVYRNPISIRRKQTPSAMAAAASEKLRGRISSIKTEKQQQNVDLLQSFVSAREAHPDLLDTTGIVGLLMSTISGAGDTTATTLTAVIYFLITHTADLKTLIAELREHKVSPLPHYGETAKFPFLNAVIRESMRCFPTITWPRERLVPAGGVTIAGYNIPQGTSVGVHTSAAHLNTDVYGEDANVFRPQ